MDLQIVMVPVTDLVGSVYNPRKWSKDQLGALKEGIVRFGVVDPLIVNSATQRKNILIGGHMRLAAVKELGHAEVPVVYLNIPDIEKERELNLRLNKNLGEFDFALLADFKEDFLKDAGFTSEDLDSIFEVDPTPEIFDLQRELEKMKIDKIDIQKGDIFDIGGSKLMCGDSTVTEDVLALMGNDKADMVMTDAPYRLMYLKGKSRNGESTTGFGMKKNRRYLETDELPADFTEKWMNNVALIQNNDFSIISYENWKNIREQWGEMEKHWKVRNMLVWHLPNRNQGFAATRKFFSKHDVAMVGTSEGHSGLNLEEEDELLENEYRTALFAISGKPHWEGCAKGKKYCPTDHIEYNAADEKSSGQSIVFGVKPPQILIPYIKILTVRGQLIYEPFGGSGSTAAASIMLGRRCNTMEKSPVYATLIRLRLEKLTGKKAVKIN